jgi:hypothetical protein
MVKSVAVGVGAALLVVSGFGGSIARAEKPRIAVVGAAGDDIEPETRQQVLKAMGEGLAGSGADVADPVVVAAAVAATGDQSCAGKECLTSVARATSVAYLVRGTLTITGRNYGFHIEILDGKTGALVDSREDRCEICNYGEALETITNSASTLKTQVFKRPAQALPPPPSPGALPPPSPLPAAAGADATSTGNGTTLVKPGGEIPPPPSAPGAHRTLGWIGVAAGVVAAGAGVALIAIDGKGTCGTPDPAGHCPNQYTTKPGGIALASAGGLALIAGIVVVAGRF